MKKLLTFVLLWLLLATVQTVSAHTQLVFSTPAHQAQLSTPPPVVHLEFNEDVRLLSLELVGDNSGTVDFGFQRNRAATDVFHFELPTLADDVYHLTWTLIGADGHRVSGVVNFTVASESGQ